jgi:hypothetical protein
MISLFFPSSLFFYIAKFLVVLVIFSFSPFKLDQSVCHHGGYPPKPRFAKLSNLELHYFHGGTAWGSAI